MYRDPITVEDVVESRLIADPLHKLDCCVAAEKVGIPFWEREHPGSADPAQS